MAFNGMYIGLSGLQVSQAALNVTSHNLANVDTEGYVRQQPVLTDFQYIKLGESYLSSKQLGLGANFAEIKQVRDMFLDLAYREEIGRKAYYESQYQAVSEIEGLFGELEGVSFQDTINDFWEAMQEMVKEPDNIVARASFVQTAVSFLERANSIYSQLCDYQVSLNTQILQQVKRINEIGDEISKLNKKITYYESSGLENANDLRDQRNLLLDELGKYAYITYREDKNGIVTVKLEGMAFVTEDRVYHMGTAKVSEDTPMLKPIWEDHGNVDVFNFDVPPSTENDTDIGSLKGLLLARGYKQANYTDIPVRDRYNSESEYKQAVSEYNNKISPSVIMTAQAQFDQLIHGIVTTINDILSPNKEVTQVIKEQDGTEKLVKVRILDEDNAPVSMDSQKIMGETLFTRKSTPRYTDPQDIQIMDEDGNIQTIKGARIYIEEDPDDNYSLFTISETEVNPNVLLNKSLLPLSKNDGTGAFDIKTAQKLLDGWETPFATLSPNTLTKNNFSDYYNSFISEIANWGEQVNTISSNQATLLESIDNKRAETMGVSADDELTNLIKYQHAYNAAARYITVVSEMLEHIIMNM
jgi:flagellar hook-associated protein FlgK